MPRGRKPKIVDDTEVQELTKFAGETAIDHVRGEDFCTFYAAEQWSFNLAKEMLRDHPDEVEVVFEETEYKAIEIRIPFKCMQYIKWPTKRTMTDEQKEAARERVKKAQDARRKKKENN